MKHKLESLEICLEKLNETEKELTKIFNEVMTGTLSLKQKTILRKKYITLNIRLFKMLKECIVLGSKEVKLENKINIIEMILLFIATIGSMIFAFFNPLFSITALILLMAIGLLKYDSLNKQVSSSRVKEMDFKEKMEQIFTIMDNIDRRLSLDIKVSKDTDGEVTTKQIDLANDAILEYLETGNIKEVDNEVKLYVIKILQSDLKNEEYNKEENNMETLLRLAKEKVDKEELNKGVKLVKENKDVK